MAKLLQMRYFMRVLGMGMSVWTASAGATNIPEGTSKLQMGSEIDKAYVAPLGLKGKPGTQAMETLLREGFRCNLRHFGLKGLDEHPYSRCIKEPSGFGNLCDELDVFVRFEPSVGIASEVDLLKQLDTIKVHSTSSLCPYKQQASMEYLAGKRAGEEILAQQVQAFDLVGNAKNAFDKLLVKGFYCGVDFDPNTLKPEHSPKLICTKWPSQIKSCYESKIVIDVEWSVDGNVTNQPLEALKSANVKAVRSSCE